MPWAPVSLLILLIVLQAGCASFVSSRPASPVSQSVSSGAAASAGVEPRPALRAEPPSVADDEARAHLDLGRTLIARGEIGAAVPRLREALRLRPDLAEAQTSLGLALYGMGDLDGAIEEYRAILRRQPDGTRAETSPVDASQARLHLGAALMAKQDWVGARAELEEVVRHRPDLLQAHYSLAVVRYTLGELDGAIAAFRRVIEIDATHADARYNLALALQLARRDAEAARELLVAAGAGVPRAQYFLGTAYATGAGVERDLARAITWWLQAAERGVTQAEHALVQLRQIAVGRARPGLAERQAVQQAFREARSELWSQFPGLPRDAEDSLGGTLLWHGRAEEALPILVREASMLSESAQLLLETLYEHGVEGQLAAHDARVLGYLKTAAAEGQPRPRIALARIYARGLGVPRDVGRAIGLLKSTPHEDAQRLLRELSAEPADDTGPARERSPRSSTAP